MVNLNPISDSSDSETVLSRQLSTHDNFETQLFFCFVLTCISSQKILRILLNEGDNHLSDTTPTMASLFHIIASKN